MGNKLVTVNLEAGRPACEPAMQRLSQELRLAKVNRARALKVIHGYGSTGKGGALRAASRQLLAERLRRGQIRLFVAGEAFGPFTNAGREAVAAVPELKGDIDFGRSNDGVTIVIL